MQNDFVDDHEFPNQSNKCSTLLYTIDGGPILRKLRHLPPPLDVVDPMFHFPFNKALYEEHLCTKLDLSYLDPLDQLKVTALEFDDHEVWVPVWNYKCIIDTGDAHPIAVKKIRNGPKEILIMWKAILALDKVGHIHQIHNG